MPRSRLVKRLLWGAAATAVALLLALTIASAILLRPAHIKSVVETGLDEHLKLDASIADVSVSLLPRPRISGAGLALRLPGRPDLPPFIEIDRFWMDAGVFSILRKHVDTVYMEGLRISVPPSEARSDLPQATGTAAGTAASDTIVNRIVTRNAVLLFVPRKPEDDPLTFMIADLTLTDVGFDRPIPFATTLTNPVPTGLVEATGTVGPWNAENGVQTPVAGKYKFSDADLSSINGIGGTLTSTGEFTGVLAAITAVGQADVPNFSLDLGGRPMPLETRFEAVVDGTDGTTTLRRVDAKMGATPMRVSGAITNLPGPGRRHVELDVQIDDGRVEDLIALSIDSPTPVLTGDVALSTKLTLPPGQTRVRDRIRLTGRFGLENANFTGAEVQEKLQSFSRRAQGKDKEDPMARVLTDLKGRFTLASGRLRLPDLTFQVPGATIALTGQYALKDGGLDFRGTLRMRATASQAVGGFKSVFIRPFNWIFRKDGAGTVLPIKVTGTREAPKFGVEVGRIFRNGS